MAEETHKFEDILNIISSDESLDSEELIAMLYKELRIVANRLLHQEAPDHTMQATELVNELFVKILGADNYNWKDKYHFFSSAVVAMRRILISHARRKSASKRIPKQIVMSLEDAINKEQIEFDKHLIVLDEVLNRLEVVDHKQAKIVEFKFFAGLSEIQIAELLKISRSTVQREWKLAKMWLMSEIYQ